MASNHSQEGQPGAMDRRSFLASTAAVVGAIAFSDLFAHIQQTGGGDAYTVANGTLELIPNDIVVYFEKASLIAKAEEAGDLVTAKRLQREVERESEKSQLDLFMERIDDVFQTAPSLNALKFFNHKSSFLGTRLDIERLVQCPQLGRIQKLSLFHCNIGPEGVRALAASRNLAGLDSLSLIDDPIGDEGMRALASSANLANLELLYLQGNHIGPAGVRALTESPHLKRLEVLILSNNSIGDEGATMLARSANFQKLRCLYLLQNRLGPQGAEALIKGAWPSLTDISLKMQRIGSAMEAPLRSRFGAALQFGDDTGDRYRAEDEWLLPIIRQPEADPVRLEAARRLEAAGDPRSELIRVQCELVSMPEYEPHNELWALSANLMASYGDLWRQSVGMPIEYSWASPDGMGRREYLTLQRDNAPSYHFRRGLLEHVSTCTRRFVTYSDELFRAAPLIRSASLQCRFESVKWLQALGRSLHLPRLAELELHGLNDEALPALTRFPRLKRLKSLRLAGSIGDAKTLAAWLRSEAVSELTSLDLSDLGLGEEAIIALATAGWPAGLTSLDLSDNWIGDEGAAALAASLPNGLRRLVLRNVGISSEGLLALVKGGRLAAVRSLNLEGNGFGAEGAESLTSGSGMAGLEVLELNKTGLGDEGAAVLASSTNLANLRCLTLLDNAIGPEGVKGLADSPHLSRLRWLDLSENLVGDAGVAALAASRTMKELGTLEMSQIQMGPAGVTALAGSPILAGLRELILSANPIGDAGAEALASSRHLGDLRLLQFIANGLGPAGVAALARSNGLPRMTVLTLVGNPIGDEGAASIAGSKNFGGLRVLRLPHSQIGDEGARALAQSDGLPRLIGLDMRNLTMGEQVKGLLTERFGSCVRLDYWEAPAGQLPP